MLNIGDTIVYGTTGVCKVERIEVKKLCGKLKQYFVLCPITQSGAAVYLPTDNEALLKKVRSVIGREEAGAFLDSIAERRDPWIESENERRAFCQNAFRSGSIDAMIAVIVSLRKRRSELLDENKRLHVADEKALREAERLICNEFSFALGLTSAEVLSRINSSL